MKRFLVALAALLFAPALAAQTTIDARGVTVAGVPLPTALQRATTVKPLIAFGATLASSNNKAAFDLADASGAPVYVPPGDWKTSTVPTGSYFGPGRIHLMPSGEIIPLDLSAPQYLATNIAGNGDRRLTYRSGPLAGASWGPQAQANTAVGPRSQRLNTTGTRNASYGWSALENAIAPIETVAFGDSAGLFSLYSDRNVFIGANAGKWAGSIPTAANGFDYTATDWSQRGEYDDLWPNWLQLAGITTDGSVTNDPSKLVQTSLPKTNGGAQFNLFIGRDTGNKLVKGVGNTLVGVHSAKGWNNSYLTALGNAACAHSLINNGTICLGAAAGNAKMSGDGDVFIGYQVAGNLVHGYANFLCGSGALPALTGNSKTKEVVDARVNQNFLCGNEGGLVLTRGTRNAIIGPSFANDAYRLESTTGLGHGVLGGTLAASNATALGYKAGQNNRSSRFTASVDGTTLTVSAMAQGSLQPGDYLWGEDIPGGTRVVALGTATGGVGTYTISESLSRSSRDMVGALDNTIALGANVGGILINNGAKIGTQQDVIVLGGRAFGSWKDVPKASSQDQTLTVGNVLQGMITRSGPTGAFTDTMPSSAELIQALGGMAEVNTNPGNLTGAGTAFDFCVVNTGGGTMTLAPGAGQTMVGLATVASGASGCFRGIVTDTATPTIKLFGLGQVYVPPATLSISAGAAVPLTTERSDAGTQLRMRRAGVDRGGLFANTSNTTLTGLGGNGAGLGFATDATAAPTTIVSVSTAGRTKIAGLATYASDAAAGTAGLVAGELYKTSAGALMVKQ